MGKGCGEKKLEWRMQKKQGARNRGKHRRKEEAETERRQEKKKRQSQRHRGQKIATERETGEGHSDRGENSTQRGLPEQEGLLPAPKCGGRERPRAAPQLELANWTPGKRQESLHLEALRVPPRGGCGDGVRHEPRLEKETGRILQRLSWQWAGKLHRLDSLVWDFSVGREDRGPAPSIPSVLGSAGGLGGSGCQKEACPTSL